VVAAFPNGARYRLHYVSAREMYNIVKAAEAGCTGDPSAFRDFEIRRITEPRTTTLPAP
jgi:hypothetical protein